MMEFPVTKQIPPRDGPWKAPAAVASSLVKMGVERRPNSTVEQEGPGNKSAARVLVVEDEPTVAALIADVLREGGFQVDILLDGISALQKTEHERYDLLICDLKMPGMNGEMLYQSLQERGDPLQQRVLFVTGDILAAHSHEFLERHHLPHLAKPFRMEELSQVVHELLQAKRLAGDLRAELTSRHVSGNG